MENSMASWLEGVGYLVYGDFKAVILHDQQSKYSIHPGFRTDVPCTCLDLSAELTSTLRRPNEVGLFFTYLWIGLAASYVGPFKVLEKVGDVAYKLELPEELSRVHNTFHVSNLKKCYADEPLAVPLDGLHFNDKL
ncbi:hypothetical protein Tco_1147824 [Tanacetum coccineum]